MPHVIVWDIETVPDLAGYAAANGHDGNSDDEIRAELGEKFPKHIHPSIICIGVLIARHDNDLTGSLRRLVHHMSVSDLRRN